MCYFRARILDYLDNYHARFLTKKIAPEAQKLNKLDNPEVQKSNTLSIFQMNESLKGWFPFLNISPIPNERIFKGMVAIFEFSPIQS